MPVVLILGLSLAGDYASAAELARAATAELDYAEAATLWEAAIESATNEDERIDSHLNAGIARRIIGDDTLARLHFLYVLKRQPDRRLTDEQPPRVRQFFDLIREEVQLNRPPDEPDRLDVSPTEVPAGPEDTPPVVGQIEGERGAGFGTLGWVGVGGAVLGGVGLIVFGSAAMASDAAVADVSLALANREAAREAGRGALLGAVVSGSLAVMGGVLIALEAGGD